MDTELWLSAKSRDSANGPPSRSTISETFDTAQRIITDRQAKTITKSVAVNNPQSSQNAAMAKKSNHGSDQSADRALRSLTSQRVRRLFEDMNESQQTFGRRMGLSQSAFANVLRRESCALHSAVRLAGSLNVSLDFLCGIIEDPVKIENLNTVPDYWTVMAIQKKKLREQKERPISERPIV